MNHKQKVKLARRMRSNLEIREKIPIFGTKAWDEMKDSIRQRIKRVKENRADKKRSA